MELLNIPEFIENNNVKQVTSSNIFLPGTEKFDPDGVYSEEIFGKIGSKDREKKFGYVDLKAKYIHPEALPIIKKIIPEYNKVIIGKKALTLNKKGLINASDISTENVEYTGVVGICKFFNDNKNNINWEHYKKIDEKLIDFILENFDRIFIDKWLIVPAGIRDLQEINNQKQEQELSKTYRYLIYLISQMNNNKDDQNITNLFISSTDTQINEQEIHTQKKIQDTLNKIIQIIHNQLKSKYGIIRGTKMSKRVDHEARLVLAHDRNLSIDEVGVPWFILLKLYEPFVIYHITRDPIYSDIYNDIQKEYNTVSVNTIRKYLNNIVQYPDNTDSHIKELFIQMLKTIIEGKLDNTPKYLIVIRHPVESRDSILAMKPKIVEENVYSGFLPQALFSTLGADVDGDMINIYSIHTKSANKELEKILPSKRTGAYSISKYGRLKVDPTMDMALAVWMMTK